MKVVLPVKLTTEGHTFLIHTVDISRSGVRVSGLHDQLQPGQVVSLIRGTQKAQFKIVWFQELSKGEFRARLEGIDVKDKFWGVDLEEHGSEGNKEMDMLLKLLKGPQKR